MFVISNEFWPFALRIGSLMCNEFQYGREGKTVEVNCPHGVVHLEITEQYQETIQLDNHRHLEWRMVLRNAIAHQRGTYS